MIYFWATFGQSLSKWLHDNLGLTWNGKEGEYIKDSTVVAFDPSVAEAGPSSLLVDKSTLLEFFSSEGYDIVWTLLGEKRIIGGNNWGQRGIGHTTLNGVYWLANGKIDGNLRGDFVSYHSE